MTYLEMYFLYVTFGAGLYLGIFVGELGKMFRFFREHPILASVLSITTILLLWPVNFYFIVVQEFKVLKTSQALAGFVQDLNEAMEPAVNKEPPKDNVTDLH